VRPDWEYSGVIPWQPHSKTRPRISAGGRRTHQDPKDKAAEKRTREFFALDIIALGVPRLVGNVAVRLVFYRQTAQWVDVDNLVKHFLDSANGMLWVDDVQVTRTSATLELDRENPRTEFWVSEHNSSMVRDLSNKNSAQ
jgi:Holliday junction resolvase RusA-like endonuclease